MSAMSDKEVAAGDAIEVRTAYDEWVPAVARSGPRYDRANAISKRHTVLTVSVSVAGWEHPINWPAEDVRLLPEGEDR